MSEDTKPTILAAIGTAAGAGTAVGVPSVLIHTPLPEDHPFYALIGRVTSEWAHLEHALDLIIWDLCGIPQPVAACVTGQILGATPRFNALIALATYKGVDEKVIDEIKQILNRTYEVQEQRNRLIHDPWYAEKSSMQPGQFKSMPKKKLQFGIRDVDEAAVRKTIADIRKRKDEVSKLWNKIFAPQKS
jgi:hypothetical protein